MDFKPEVLDKLHKLKEKYEAMGQDLESYLEGLLHADYLKYWEYINLDVLLNLQNPITPLHDEKVFIIYHQITELYFKLCLEEYQLISENKGEMTGDFFLNHINRILRNFDALVHSFDIMIDGMNKEEFRKFRMALLPASGFQSAQYRKIEISSTPFINLVQKENKKNLDIDKDFDKIYWKKGATELASGKKTLTLELFEEKYDEELKQLAKDQESKNLWECYLSLDDKDRERNDIKESMRALDHKINVEWGLVHYRSVARYLQQKSKSIEATGGTNWQDYLPPKKQMLIFFPELWSNKEKEEWGKHNTYNKNY